MKKSSKSKSPNFRTMPVYKGGPSGGHFTVIGPSGKADVSRMALEEASGWLALEEAFYVTGLYVEQIAEWIEKEKIVWRRHQGRIEVRVFIDYGAILSADLSQIYYLRAREREKRLDNFEHSIVAEEVGIPTGYYEGAMQQIVVNTYERNRKARDKCVEHYGYECSVCNHSMADLYGEVGEGVIHVHHLRELSSIGEKYKLDPIADLRPVCPNCHLILHTTIPAMCIEELRDQLNARRQRKKVGY